MSNPILSAALTRMRRALNGSAHGSLADGRLLSRFVSCRDEGAFANLVERHGPMVLAVCRRVTGDAHLADDAFQATFLVLARRAGDVRPREAVRSWLYGVAVRTAQDARSTSARRRSREVPMPRVPDRPVPAALPAANADALRALDEEIARLPDHLRAAVVLCELDGASRKEAAARLDIPEGTLSSRLAKARKVLAGRLRGRGVALTAVGLTALFGSAPAAAAVPAALRSAAVRLAAPGPVSAAVNQLAQGVLGTMLLSKLKFVATALAVVVLLGGLSAWSMLRPARAEDPPNKPAARHEVPRSDRSGHLFYSRDGKLYGMDPDGKNERRITLPDEAGWGAVPSPDGRSVAYWTADGRDQAWVCTCGLDGRGDRMRIKLPGEFGFIRFCWSPDAKELHVNLGGPVDPEVRHFRVGVKTKTLSRLNVLKTHLVEEWSPDGKYLLTTGVGNGPQWEPRSLHLMNPDGTEHRALTGPNDWALAGRLSPDGKRLLCLSINGNDSQLAVMDVGKPESLTPVAGVPEGAEVVGYAWSPDGKRIAFATGASRTLTPDELRNLESRLIVADPDGKNATVLRNARGEQIVSVYWSGAFAEQAPVPAAGESKPEALTARQILDRVAHVYASCKSYQDSGVVSTVFVEAGGKRRTVAKPFTTAFIRPERFRFEYQEKALGGQDQRYIVWRKGNEVQTWWDVRPGVEKPASLGLALGGATGVSGGSAHTIPALLLPDQVLGRLTDMTEAQRGAYARLDKSECFRIEGKVGGQPTTLWIDRATFLVRRIDTQRKFANFRTETTTTYEPAVDGEVEAKKLEFDAPKQK
jgi:RNA polymerase sigma factor (sigma-70 family)